MWELEGQQQRHLDAASEHPSHQSHLSRPNRPSHPSQTLLHSTLPRWIRFLLRSMIHLVDKCIRYGQQNKRIKQDDGNHEI